jgi:hypothetical protein
MRPAKEELRFGGKKQSQLWTDSRLNMTFPVHLVLHNYWDKCSPKLLQFGMSHPASQHSYCIAEPGKSSPFRLLGGFEARP